MAKRRCIGGMARNVFALFWIALGGLSGFYLFTLLTDPSAAGGQTAQTSEPQAALAPAAPPPPVAAVPPPSVDSAEVDSLKGTIQDLTQKLTALDERLKPIEGFIGPVAVLPPSNSVSTSRPAPEPQPVTAAPPPPPAPTPPPAPSAETVAEEAVVEAPPPPPSAPPPVAVVPEPAPPPPAPPTPSEAAPNSAAPAPEAQAAEEQTAEKEVEIAAYDPVALPPAANDGSTRYGIEIGSVATRDALRPLWREYLTKHAALVAGLQPRRILAPDNKWRLIAGPFDNAQDAEGACSLFKKADRPCAATVYAGDAL